MDGEEREEWLLKKAEQERVKLEEATEMKKETKKKKAERAKMTYDERCVFVRLETKTAEGFAKLGFRVYEKLNSNRNLRNENFGFFLVHLCANVEILRTFLHFSYILDFFSLGIVQKLTEFSRNFPHIFQGVRGIF